MPHVPRSRAARILAGPVLVIAFAAALSGCGSEDPASAAPTSTATSGQELAAAAAGTLALSGGWVIATDSVPTASPSAAGETDGAMDGSMDSATDGSMDMGGSYVSAAFATLANDGGSDDALVAVTGALEGDLQLHNTVATDDGTAGTMVHVDVIDVPAHGTTTLQPGGYHVMMMGLTAPLREGDGVRLTFHFRSGAELTATFPIISRENRPQ